MGQPACTLGLQGKLRQLGQHTAHLFVHKRVMVIHPGAIFRHTAAVLAVKHHPICIYAHFGPQAVASQPVILIFAGSEALIKVADTAHNICPHHIAMHGSKIGIACMHIPVAVDQRPQPIDLSICAF